MNNPIKIKINQDTIYKILLVTLLISGFLLRIYKNDAGLPFFSLNDDMESYAVRIAMTMINSNDLNPHEFYYPTLSIYIYVIIFKLIQLCSIIGLISFDSYSLILAARYISAVFGTLTIFIVYLIGKTLYTRQIGLIAASFLTAAPLAVAQSHYGSIDSAVTFFISISFLFSSKLIKSNKLKYYILAGSFAGLAFSTKYPGGLVIICLIIVNILSSLSFKQSKSKFEMAKNMILSKYLAISFIFMIGSIVASMPYSVLDFKVFITDIVYAGQLLVTGSVIDYHQSMISHVNYYIGNLDKNLTQPLELLAIIGVIYLIIYNIYSIYNFTSSGDGLDKILANILIISWIFIYFFEICSWTFSGSRYFLPLVPFLTLIGALFIIDLFDHIINMITSINKAVDIIPLKNVIVVIICAFIFVIGADCSIKEADNLIRPDCRIAALYWIADNVPKGSLIALESPDCSPELDYLPDIKYTAIGWMYPNINITNLAKKNVNYLLITDVIISKYNLSHKNDLDTVSYLKEENFRKSLKDNCQLAKYIAARHSIYGPIKIYRIARVPLPSNNHIPLDIIDPISKTILTRNSTKKIQDLMFSHGFSVPFNSEFAYTTNIIDNGSSIQDVLTANLLNEKNLDNNYDQFLLFSRNLNKSEKNKYSIQILNFINNPIQRQIYIDREGIIGAAANNSSFSLLAGDFMELGYDQVFSLASNQDNCMINIGDFSQKKHPAITRYSEALANNSLLKKLTDPEDVQLAGDFLALGYSQVLFMERSSNEKQLVLADFTKSKSAQATEISLTGESSHIARWLDKDDLQLAGDFMNLGHSQVLFINRNHTKDEKEKLIIIDFGNGRSTPFIKYLENWGDSSKFSGWLDANDTQLVGDFMDLGYSQVLFVNHGKNGGKIAIIDFGKSGGKPPALTKFVDRWNGSDLFEGWLGLNDTKIAGDFKGLGYSQVLFLNSSNNGTNATIVEFASGKPLIAF